MPTKTFPEAELFEILETCEEVDSKPWRHGQRVTYAFEHEGAHWLVTVDVHHDEGIQLYGPTPAFQARQVEKVVKVWERVPEPGAAP